MITTRRELETKLYNQGLGTQKIINNIVMSLFTLMSEELNSGNSVLIKNFGKFKPSKSKPKQITLPISKLQIVTSPKKIVRFKSSPNL